MAKSWSQVRDSVADLVDGQRVANAEKAMREEVRAHHLAEIRRQHGESQTALAQIMHVSQARVSKIERGELSCTELGTLQSYIEALGGSLEVSARFGDQTITVK